METKISSDYSTLPSSNVSDTLTCLMCRGVISFSHNDNTKFFNHLKHEHSIHFNKELVLAINLLKTSDLQKIISGVNINNEYKHVKEENTFENVDDNTKQESGTFSEQKRKLVKVKSNVFKKIIDKDDINVMFDLIGATTSSTRIKKEVLQCAL